MPFYQYLRTNRDPSIPPSPPSPIPPSFPHFINQNIRQYFLCIFLCICITLQFRHNQMGWFEVSLQVVTTMAVAVQMYAIWLVLHKSPIPMHPYRFFLIANSISDMLFAVILGFLMQPDLLFPAPALIVRGLAKYAGPYGGILSFALAVFAGTSQVHFQNWSLLYRWSVVQERFAGLAELLTSTGMLLFIFAHGQLIGAAIALGTCSLFVEPMNVPSELGTRYQIVLASNASEEVFLLANLANGLQGMSAILPIIGIGLFACMSFWVCISSAILRLFRAHAHVFSTRTYQLHMQLNILLIVQLLSPILLIIAPVILGILGLVAHAEYGKSAGQLGVLLLALYALTNPLITVLFVTPYRRFTLKIVRLESMKWPLNWRKLKGEVQPRGGKPVWRSSSQNGQQMMAGGSWGGGGGSRQQQRTLSRGGGGGGLFF